MSKHILVVILWALALHIEARVDKHFHRRVAWVKELKTFVQDLQERNPMLLTTYRGQEFLKKLSFFEAAYASSNYDCFFAGWPSKLVKSGGRKVCQSPSRGNAEYENGGCQSGELQCQPLMFGKGLCVGFKTSGDKQLAFAKCENKFKAKGNFDFLQMMTPEEKTALKEISLLARSICEEGSIGVQKSRPMCRNLLARFNDSMSAIERAPAQAEETQVAPVPGDADYVDPIEQQELEPETVVEKKEVSSDPASEEICEVPIVVDKKIEVESSSIIKTVNNDADQLYIEIKKEFRESAHCRPEMVLNDPKEKLSPVLFSQLMEEMRFMIETGDHLTREVKMKRFKEIVQNHKLSPATQAYGEELLNKYEDTPAGRFEAMARLRGVMAQDMAEVAKRTPGYGAQSIQSALAQRGIFATDEDGRPECPFVDEKAFRQALAGREAVLKSANKSAIKNVDLLTIVDYTKPSNQRRMFVIDLKTKKVLHNTWVAQGGGKDRSQELGSDGLGSHPLTSNEPKSLLSSEGFYLASQASRGSVYLNNLTLKGIDEANSNMESRAIVVHGWRTPNSEYVSKTWEMSEKPLTRQAGRDIYREFMQLDFKTTKEDLFNITQELKAAADSRDYVDATDGCLGVPDTNMGHVDRKGRNKSQLELLREDLPGSLMFNYTGPDTRSKYLK